MNLTTVFCNIDDFCREFTLESPQELLPMPSPRRNRRAGLGLSEIMTILVMFHHSGEHRNFKGYYTQHVCRHWSGEFPGAPRATAASSSLSPASCGRCCTTWEPVAAR